MKLNIVIPFVIALAIACLLISPVGLISAQQAKPVPTETPVVISNSLTIPPTLLPKIEPQLLTALQNITDSVPFIVYLHEKAKVDVTLARTKPDQLSQRTALVQALQSTANRTQSGLLQELQTPRQARNGQIRVAEDIRSLWIINAISAKGTVEHVLTVAADPAVKRVGLDKTIQLDLLPADKIEQRLQAATELAWGIEKVQSQKVHDTYNIDGTGVVVANVDTGVDWNHPDLQTRYRGFTGFGKPPIHAGNWYDTFETAVYPVDSNGHGTHTMGTIVAENGYGVAPGATWIAVRAFNGAGNAQLSWLHAAYQWLLAPNNDPSLAPDVVNNSWSSKDGTDLEYAEDVELLTKAGVFMIFSTGNEGPSKGTVGSPGSLNGSFSVGGTDINDEMYRSSSRGPSPWGELKPAISAPGKNVLSTLPGGTYGKKDGTSMAAPHVAGTVALLLQADPTLGDDFSRLIRVLTSTTVARGETIPNNNFGWGRLDSYSAVASVVAEGVLTGFVTENDVPISQATLQLVARNRETQATAQTDNTGYYQQGIAPNLYDVTASAFGYLPTTTYGIDISAGAFVQQNFSLTPMPHGTLVGKVLAQITQQAISATITINNTPIQYQLRPPQSRFQLNLPVGQYTMTIIAKGYRTEIMPIIIEDGQTTTQDLFMQSAPTILLVDSGYWQNESQRLLYQASLDALRYQYDVWTTKGLSPLSSTIPSSETLSTYDIVIWSSPRDAPGYLGANEELIGYLNQGGNLFLSGQDVAYYDGGGATFQNIRPYFKNYLYTKYVNDNALSTKLTGASQSPLAGLSLTLNRGDGADNQISPDVIESRNLTAAYPLIHYDNGLMGGLYTDTCLPYRVIYLAFGFEGIDNQQDRLMVLKQSLDWFTEERPRYAFELKSAKDIVIGDLRDTVSHTVQIRNVGSTADRYNITLTPNQWPFTNQAPAEVTVEPCQTYTFTPTVTIETDEWHVFDTFTTTIQSANQPSMAKIITQTSKSIAPLLLVDDGRFISFAPLYQDSLAGLGIGYDYWSIPTSWAGPVPPSPPTDTLTMYPMVIWYTGSDWSTPLHPAEEQRLASYLDQGGRLMFSSQDYIYQSPNHRPSEFAKTYFGILNHTEDLSSTLVVGNENDQVGAHLGPYHLTFPPGYNNWTDALEPVETAKIVTVGQKGQINGISHAGVGSQGENWHTLFYSYGPELLAPADRIRLIQRSVGWLSWLGQSSLSTNATKAVSGDTLIYTATIANNGWHNLPTASFTATFPTGVEATPLSTELKTHGNDLVWQGALAKNETKQFQYTAKVSNSAPIGLAGYQQSWFSYPEHGITVDRQTELRLNFPDLSHSNLTVTPSSDIQVDDELVYTLVLSNDSQVNLPVVTVTTQLPETVVLFNLDTPANATVITTSNTITWTFPMQADDTLTWQYSVKVKQTTNPTINMTVQVNDGAESRRLSVLAFIEPNDVYLPIITR